MGFIWIILAAIAALRMCFQGNGNSYGAALILSCITVTFLGALMWFTVFLFEHNLESGLIVGFDILAAVLTLLCVSQFKYSAQRQFLAGFAFFGFPALIGIAQITNLSGKAGPYGIDVPIMTLINVAIAVFCWIFYKKSKAVTEEYRDALMQLDVPQYIIRQQNRADWDELRSRGASFDTNEYQDREMWATLTAERMMYWQPVFGQRYIPWYDPEHHVCNPSTYVAPPKKPPVEIGSFMAEGVPRDSISAFSRLT